MKRKACRTWQLSRSPRDKAHYNKLTKELRHLLQDERNRATSVFLQNLSPHRPSTHNLRKIARWLKSLPNVSFLSGPLTAPGFVSPKKKLMLLPYTCPRSSARILQSPPKIPTQPPLFPSFLSNSTICSPFTLSSFRSEIHRLRPRKASGCDLIQREFCGGLSPICLGFLIILLNRIVFLSYFPASWKVAGISVIPKPGKDLERVADTVLSAFSRSSPKFSSPYSYPVWQMSSTERRSFQITSVFTLLCRMKNA